MINNVILKIHIFIYLYNYYVINNVILENFVMKVMFSTLKKTYYTDVINMITAVLCIDIWDIYFPFTRYYRF